MRLADRLGLLTGRNLAPAAVFGVEVLMMLEARDRKEQWDLDFKTRLAVANPLLIPDLFPNHDPDPFAAAKTSDGEYDIDKIDDSAIEWGVPESVQEREDLDAWIAEHMGGTIGAPGLDQGGDWQ